MIDEGGIQYRWNTVGSKLDERGRRLFAAAEVRTAGWGGLSVVSRITGLARSTINRGEDDLDAEPLAKGKIRRSGGGRRAVAETDPELVPELKRLVEPAILGDPMRPALYALQHAISIGEEAEVSLIETHGPHQSQAISHTRLAIAAGASVKHVRLAAGETSKQLASAAVTLAERAHYEPLQMAVNGAVVRAEAAIRFEGPNARCHYTGAMLLQGHSHADFTLVVDHVAPGCESRELVKAVLDGRSRGVFQGKVIVERGAQKTDGKQMANALLLSDDAEFDSKPELEIFADDVVCGHGSTAGQLDQDMLFYLRARGIAEAEARSLLIAAFVGEALDKIDNEALRAALDEKVAAWLDGTMLDPAT